MTESATSETVKTTNRLVERALGPTFDVLGEYFAERMTEYVNANRRRIAERAISKSPHSGLVHPWTAYKVFEQGSLADGPLMAEYFGGILAGSKTPDGRDDSGVAWTTMLGSMSRLQRSARITCYIVSGPIYFTVKIFIWEANIRARPMHLHASMRNLREESTQTPNLLNRHSSTRSWV